MSIELQQLIFMITVGYVSCVNIAYFIFNSYFKAGFGREFKYWSCYTMQFNFKPKRGTKEI